MTSAGVCLQNDAGPFVTPVFASLIGYGDCSGSTVRLSSNVLFWYHMLVRLYTKHTKTSASSSSKPSLRDFETVESVVFSIRDGLVLLVRCAGVLRTLRLEMGNPCCQMTIGVESGRSRHRKAGTWRALDSFFSCQKIFTCDTSKAVRSGLP